MSRNQFIHLGIVLCFVLQTLFPQNIWASEINETSSGGGAQIFLESQQEAVKFGESIVRKIKAEEQLTHKKLALGVYHVQGLAPDPYFKTVLEVVSKAGIPIKGTLLTQDKFDQQIQSLPNNSKVLLRYKSKFRDFGKKIFGLPYGLTFYEHFVAEDSNGNKIRRFPNDWNITLQSFVITLGGMANLSLALLLHGIKSSSLHFWLPSALLAAWIPPFVYFQREISSFRMQGRSVVTDEAAKPGEQIQVTDNKALFTSLVIAQEWLLNLLLAPAIFGSYKLAQMANGLLNATLGAYGSVFAEHWKGDLFLKAERAGKEGNHQMEEKLSNKAKWINFVWFMAVFPLLKNIEFLTGPTHWLAMPFIILGTAFLFEETLLVGEGPYGNRIKRNLKRIFLHQPQSKNDLLYVVPE